MIDVKKASVSLGTLAVLNFFPAADDVRTAILSEVCEMAADNEQIEWLARRARRLWRRWEGMHELRALYCSRYRPADGFEVFSALPQFSDGIPAEKESERKELGAGDQKQISGAAVTADQEMQELAAIVANARVLPLPRVKVGTSVMAGESELSALMRSVEDFRGRVKPTSPRIVTQTEIDAIKNEQEKNRKESK